MIARVAEHCFWLLRYVERTEHTARLLLATRAFTLDTVVPVADRWWPAIVVAGEQERFQERHPRGAGNDAEVVQRYLTWDEANPVSLLSSARWARENARTIRDLLSLEAWERWNAFWTWLRSGPGKRLYNQDRDAFYQRAVDAAALFRGVAADSMLVDEAWEFMRLGQWLERAGQVARLVDVHHHTLGPLEDEAPLPLHLTQWLTLLRAVAGESPFLRRHRRSPSGHEVAAFLLLDAAFPRAVRYCLGAADRVLARIESETGRRRGTAGALLEQLLWRLQAANYEQLVADGLHRELTRVVDTTAQIAATVAAEYFGAPGESVAS